MERFNGQSRVVPKSYFASRIYKEILVDADGNRLLRSILVIGNITLTHFVLLKGDTRQLLAESLYAKVGSCEYNSIHLEEQVDLYLLSTLRRDILDVLKLHKLMQTDGVHNVQTSYLLRLESFVPRMGRRIFEYSRVCLGGSKLVVAEAVPYIDSIPILGMRILVSNEQYFPKHSESIRGRKANIGRDYSKELAEYYMSLGCTAEKIVYSTKCFNGTLDYEVRADGNNEAYMVAIPTAAPIRFRTYRSKFNDDIQYNASAKEVSDSLKTLMAYS